MHVCCFGSSPRRGTAINRVWKSLLQRRVFKIYSLKRGQYQCFVPVVCRYWYLRTSRVFDSDLHAPIVQRGQAEKHHSTIYCLETPPVFCTRQGVALIQSAYLQGGVWAPHFLPFYLNAVQQETDFVCVFITWTWEADFCFDLFSECAFNGIFFLHLLCLSCNFQHCNGSLIAAVHL